MAISVLVVGAGPSGLTAAVELARRGIGVSVIERRDGPSPLSRAVGIQRRSIALLRPSGVADAILAEAIRFSGVRFHVGAREVAHLPLNFDDRSRIWGLPQDRTEHHLLAALERLGGSVRFGTALTGLEQDPDGVTAVTGKVQERHDYLVGADGVDSTVRDALGLAFPGRDLPGAWSIADVDSPDWPGRDAFMGYLLPQGDVAVVVPLEPGRYRVIASRTDALAALPVPMDVARLRRSGTFRISVRQVARYDHARVFLAGDAAHCHSPVGGRGMNLGIADAADLAQRIAKGDTAGYGPARHAAGRQVIRFSEAGRRMLQSDSAWRRGVAVTALRLGASIPPLGRAMARRFVGR